MRRGQRFAIDVPQGLLVTPWPMLDRVPPLPSSGPTQAKTSIEAPGLPVSSMAMFCWWTVDASRRSPETSSAMRRTGSAPEVLAGCATSHIDRQAQMGCSVGVLGVEVLVLDE